MADIKIVGSKSICDKNECDCHVDHKTIGGKGTKHDPFKVIGLPPWDPFATITTRIFARESGSDKHGNGSIEKPYRTAQRAFQFIPRQINPGQRVVVDITGSSSPANPEVFPKNYALPAIQGPFGLDIASSFPDADFPFTTVTSLEIIATPQLASSVAPADQIITSADLVGPGITFDPDTNLFEIHTNKSYAVDALRGLFLQGATGTNGVIWHNTAGPNSVIFVTSSNTPDEPLAPMFAPPVTPLSIRECGAAFETNKGPADAIKGGFYIAGDGSLGLRGIQFKLNPAETNPTAFNVEVFGSRTIFFENCTIDTLGMFHSGGEITFISTMVGGSDQGLNSGAFVSQLPVNFLSSFLHNITSFGMWAVPTTFKALGFVAEGCVAIGPRLDAFTPVGRGPAIDIQLRNGVIHSSIPDLNYAQIADGADFPAPFFPFSLCPQLATPGHGIIYRGTHATITNVKIFDCADDGIHGEAGSGMVEIKSVTGGQGGVVFGDLPDNPNGGYGLNISDGIVCRVSDQDPANAGVFGGCAALPNPIVTNVSGVAVGPGSDILVGDGGLAVRTWAGFHTGGDGFPAKQWCDVTVVSPVNGATGTLSRLFEKP